MTDIATRNRQIKKVLEQAFGRGKVRVQGSRGTAYGWVRVNIDHTPLSGKVSEELRGHIMKLLAAAKIEIGRYDSADYGSGYEISINFNHARYRRHTRTSEGAIFGLRWDDDQWEPYAA